MLMLKSNRFIFIEYTKKPKFRTGLNNTGCSQSGMGDLKYTDNLTESRDLASFMVKPSVGSPCEANPDAEIIF